MAVTMAENPLLIGSQGLLDVYVDRCHNRNNVLGMRRTEYKTDRGEFLFE